ncbi:ssxt (amine-terminal region) protein, partial [Cystoisospora suis]
MATLDDIDAFFDALVDGGNDEEETGAGGGGGEENEDGSSMALLHPSGGSPSSCLLGESSTLNLDRLRSPDFSLSPGNSSFLPHTSSLLGVEKDASLHTASHVGLGNIHQLRHTALPPAVSTPGVSTANRLHSQPSSSSSLPPVSSSSGGFEAGRVVSGGQDHSSSLDGRGKPIFPSEGIPQRQGHTPGDGVRTLERGLPGGVYTPGNSSQGKGDVGGVLGGENHEAQRGRYVLGGASAGAQDMRQVETSTKGLVASSLPTSTALSDGSLLHAVTSSSSFGVKNRQEGGDHQQGQCSTSSSSYSTRVLSDSTAKKLGTSSSAHSLISPSPRFDLTSPKPTGESTLGPLSGDGVHTARILEVPPSLSSSSSAQITAPHLAKDVPRSFLSPQHQGNASLSSSASSIPPSFSSLHPTSAPGHPQSSSLASHPLSSSSSSLSSDSSSLSLDPRKTYSQPPSKHASLQYGQDGHGVGRSSSSSSSSPSGLSMPHPSSSVGSFPPYPPFAMHPHPSLHPAAPSSHFLSRHPRLIVPLSKELAEEEGGVLGGEKKRGFLVNLGQDGSGPPEFTVPPSLLVPSLSPGPIGQGEGGEEEQDRGEGERDITLQQSMAFCSQTVSRLIQAKLLENDQMLYAVHENLSAGRYEEAVCFFERLQQNLFFLAMLADQ